MLSIHLKHSTDASLPVAMASLRPSRPVEEEDSMPGDLIAAVRKAFPEFRREQAYGDLMALDEHSLADIGLLPGVIAWNHSQLDTAPGSSRRCR
jgi:hypothetical protein